MKYKSLRSKKQKSRSHRRSKSHKRSQSRSKRRSQRGGAILTPAVYSNSNNDHFSGGFTDQNGAKTGCTGSTSSSSALRGVDVFTTIGGIKTPVTMKGGARKRSRTQRGGNTNGYSIGGVHLKPSLSGIATNYHTAYDSCKV
jgi:hypothetical protein